MTQPYRCPWYDDFTGSENEEQVIEDFVNAVAQSFEDERRHGRLPFTIRREIAPEPYQPRRRVVRRRAPAKRTAPAAPRPPRTQKPRQRVKESAPPTRRNPTRASTRAYGSKPSEAIIIADDTKVEESEAKVEEYKAEQEEHQCEAEGYEADAEEYQSEAEEQQSEVEEHEAEAEEYQSEVDEYESETDEYESDTEEYEPEEKPVATKKRAAPPSSLPLRKSSRLVKDSAKHTIIDDAMDVDDFKLETKPMLTRKRAAAAPELPPRKSARLVKGAAQHTMINDAMEADAKPATTRKRSAPPPNLPPRKSSRLTKNADNHTMSKDAMDVDDDEQERKAPATRKRSAPAPTLPPKKTTGLAKKSSQQTMINDAMEVDNGKPETKLAVTKKSAAAPPNLSPKKSIRMVKPSDQTATTNDAMEVDDVKSETKPAATRKRAAPPAYLPPRKSTRLINDRWWDEINAELQKAGKPSVPKRARTSCTEDPVEFLSELPKPRRKSTRYTGKENAADEEDGLAKLKQQKETQARMIQEQADVFAYGSEQMYRGANQAKFTAPLPKNIYEAFNQTVALEQANKAVPTFPEAPAALALKKSSVAHGPIPGSASLGPMKVAFKEPTQNVEDAATLANSNAASDHESNPDDDSDATLDFEPSEAQNPSAAGALSVAFSHATSMHPPPKPKQQKQHKLPPINLAAPFPSDFVRRRRHPNKKDLAAAGITDQDEVKFYQSRPWGLAWWQGLAINVSGKLVAEKCRQCASDGVDKVFPECKILGRVGAHGRVVRKCGNCYFGGYACSFLTDGTNGKQKKKDAKGGI